MCYRQTPNASGGNGARPERRRTGTANTTEEGANIDDNAPDRTGGAKLGPPVKSVADAIAALMDTPHPLDILGEPGSYGFTVGVHFKSKPIRLLEYGLVDRLSTQCPAGSGS